MSSTFSSRCCGNSLLHQRHEHVVAADDDLLDAFGAHHAIEHVRNLLDVLLVVLADVALVARLRPAADLRLLRLDALDLVLPYHLAGAEDEDAGEVRVGDDGRIAGN